MHPEGLVNYLYILNLMLGMKSILKNENNIIILIREIEICNIFCKGTNTF